MKPQQLAITAAALVAGAALVKWLLADDDDEKLEETKQLRTAALRAKSKEIQARKAIQRRPKRARPTAAKRLQQNNALAVAYGGSREAVDVAARALREHEKAARERLDAALEVYDGLSRDAPEIEIDLAWWPLMDARQRRSLGRQLADTVAKCRRALKPTIVTLSSYTNEAKTHLEAIGSAKSPVIRDERDTWKRRRERTARVVYLTPDADEALEGATYPRGTVAMANSGPGTNGSQFFLVYKDSPGLDPDYTPVGRITQGLEVLDEVAAAGSTPPGDGSPKLPVTIETFRTSGPKA